MAHLAGCPLKDVECECIWMHQDKEFTCEGCSCVCPELKIGRNSTLNDACDDAPFGSGDRVWFYDSELVVIHSSYRDASGIRYVIWHEDGTLKACRDEHLFAEPTNATRHAYESLIGRTIVDVRSMTPDEVNRIWGGEGWGHILVVLDDGTEFTPSRDDEGNGPGTIFVSPWDSEDD